MASKLDAMKAAASHAPIATPSVTVPEKKEALLKGMVKTVPLCEPSPAVKVVYRCSHSESVKAFLAGDCPMCRNKAKQAKAAKNREEREKTASPAIGRLPDGADFHAVYDAASQTWTGTLIIGGATFRATASGLQKALLSELDAQYRASLAPV